jgi:secondary thiamine-phosphate synthase enzyme
MNILLVKTNKKEELIDITSKVNEVIKFSEGVCNIFVKHATAALIINENYDINICKDFLNFLNEIIPKGKWLHDKIDDNGAAHLKASLLGCSVSIPIKNRRLDLGKWQSLMLVELDGPREREIIVNFR